MKTLDLWASLALLQRHHLPVARSRLVKRAAGLARVRGVPFPWAMKAVSGRVTHKTEHGGVVLGVEDLAEARKAFRRLARVPGFCGAVVQEQARGVEVIVGAKRDPQFGPVVLCGTGGIYAEVLRDTSLRIAPLEPGEARDMIRELRGYPLLAGARGRPRASLAALTRVIEGVARLVWKEKRVQELDLNPVLCGPRRAVCVDARAVVA